MYEEWHAARGWRVAREEAGHATTDGLWTAGGEPVPVELDSPVVETIVWKEELFMSEAEEVSRLNLNHWCCDKGYANRGLG